MSGRGRTPAAIRQDSWIPTGFRPDLEGPGPRARARPRPFPTPALPDTASLRPRSRPGHRAEGARLRGPPV